VSNLEPDPVDSDDDSAPAGSDGHDNGGDDGNVRPGGRPAAVLEYLTRSIVDDPSAIEIDAEERRRGGIDLHLSVAPDDMGKVIGRRGRVAQALRTVVRAAGARDGVEVNVSIDD